MQKCMVVWKMECQKKADKTCGHCEDYAKPADWALRVPIPFRSSCLGLTRTTPGITPLLCASFAVAAAPWQPQLCINWKKLSKFLFWRWFTHMRARIDVQGHGFLQQIADIKGFLSFIRCSTLRSLPTINIPTGLGKMATWSGWSKLSAWKLPNVLG